MIDDAVPLIHQFDNTIIIHPVFDLHVGDMLCNLQAWHRFKKLILSDPQNYIVIGGDMANNALKNSKSNSYESTIRPREQKTWLTQEIGDLRDRVLCINPGNHERRSQKEADDEMLYDACVAAGIDDRYRENAVFMIIRMGDKKGDGLRNPTYKICAMHGTGGGLLTGAGVNRTERFGTIIDGLDALITGHTHKGAITKPGKIVFDAINKKVTVKSFANVISTSWLSYGGYALRGMMQPADTDRQRLTLHRDQKQIEVVW